MIELRQFHKSFGSVVALDDLSIAIGKGELFGLLGPNGAGKTTAVRGICGLISPDRGDVTVGGKPPTDLHTRAIIGLAPQELAVYEELSAQENLAFFGRLYGLRRRPLRDRIEWCLGFAGLQDRRRDRVSTYSGGMKRRLNLAVALIHDPNLLVLDEPTVGVDAQSRNAILASILKLREQGRTIIYSTHYMEEACRLCDRAAIVDHGRLLCISVTVAFLLPVTLFELTIRKKCFSTGPFSSLPATVLLFQTLLQPLLEELLFRGFLMTELLALLSLNRALALTSLLFAGIHGVFWLSHGATTWAIVINGGACFVFSLLAGWLFAKTGSIWPSTCAHIANNLLFSMLAVGGA